MSRRRKRSNPISLFSFQDIVTSVTGILILLAILLAISVINQRPTSKSSVELVDTTPLEAKKAGLESRILQLEKQLSESQVIVNSWISASPEELQNQKSSLESAIALQRQEMQTMESSNQQLEISLKQFIDDPETANTNAKVAELNRKLEQTKLDLNELRSGSRVVYNFRSSTKTAWIAQFSGTGVLVCRAGENAAPKQFTTAKDLLTFAKGLPEAERYLVLVVRPSGIRLYDTVHDQLEAANIDLGVDLIAESEVVVDSIQGAGFK